MKELEKIMKGLANKRRLAIIRLLLKSKEATVADIAEQIKLSFKSTSKHLAILHQLDILDRRQENLNMYYRLSDSLPEIVCLLSRVISNSRE